MRNRKILAGVAAIAIPAAALAQAAPRYLNQRDVAEAQRQHPELVAEFGGAETGARAAYVQSVGQRVAAYSGVPSNVYQFTTSTSLAS
jgi:predicted Zn-dependent protease